MKGNGPVKKAATLRGRVVSGKGKAALFLSLKNYGRFIAGQLGLLPYPGTLNVKVDPGEKEKFLAGKIRLRLRSFAHDGKRMGGITAYPVKFEGRVPALLVAPDKSTHAKGIVEVVAVASLRRGLKLRDGSKVVIS